MSKKIEKDKKLVREFIALMADKKRYAEAIRLVREEETKHMSPKKYLKLNGQQQKDFLSGAKSARDINIAINIQGGN